MTPPIPAASLVLTREGGRLEVLLVERPAATAFMPAHHVFPGGALEPADGPPEEEGAFRQAAVRETAEETGLRVETAALRPVGWWCTPATAPRRYDTRFFWAEAPPGQQLAPDPAEVASLGWWAPAEALQAWAAERLLLAPPTLALLELLAATSTGAAFAGEQAASAGFRICPQPRTLPSGRAALVLPGDPLYSPPAAPVLPHRTRFVHDGRRFG